MTTDLNIQIFQWIHTGAGTRPIVDGFAAASYLLMARLWTTWGIVFLVVGLASAGLIHWLAGCLNPLNMKLIRVSNQLMDRVVRSRSHGTRRQ